MLGRFRIVILIFIVLVASAAVLFISRSRQLVDSKAKPIPIVVSNSTLNGIPSSSGSDVSPVSIRLSEGQAQPQAAQPVPVATGEALSQVDIDKILARLPTLTAQPGAQMDFKLAQGPIPPPAKGQTVQEPFPPAEQPTQPPAVEPGPLKVLRYAPEGEVPIAPFLSITFNQPMVALTTLSDLAAKDEPMKIEPSLPGAWRWLGTRTLTFEYDSKLIDRLPKATIYHVTIPAGTTSTVGGVLQESVSWTFSTPAPKVTFSYPPNEPQPREPLFFVHFDQRIDPEAVLKTIQVTAANQSASLELVSQAEIRADKKNSGLLDQAVDGRWVAFRAKEPLPADVDVQVRIGPGTPSAEGALVTKEAQSYSFHTYAPLHIEEHGCSWGNSVCQPNSPFYIRFNNPIDAHTYLNSMLRIEPELPGASVNIIDNTINIQGASQGQTTYTVTVDGSLKDTFGQKLGQNARLTFKVGPAEPVLTGPQGNFVTLDPASQKPVFSIYDINYPRLDLKVYAVQPSDWPAFNTYLQNYYRIDVTVTVPGRLVIGKTINVESKADALTEVDIDLSPAMDGKYGHFIVIVEPPKDLIKNDQNTYRPTVQAWVQVTQIGLDAFADHSEMIAWSTDLKTGAPLANIPITAEHSGHQTVTGADGTVRFTIPDGATYLVASQGTDQALLPNSTYFWGDESWRHSPVKDELRWYVFDDRQMYRPGEDVHVKGWLRRIGGKQNGDVDLVGGDLTAVHYQIIDSQGNMIGDGQAEANALGGFDFVFTLPQKVNLGYAQVLLSAVGNVGGLDGQQYNHNFQIQEFRRPEFEVKARNETSGPYFSGEHAVVAVEASYYAGGPLPNADVTWQVTSSPSHYAPPNWPDFTFGTWTPWWQTEWTVSAKPYLPGETGSGGQVETFTGTTDSAGTQYLRLDFDKTGQLSPLSVVAQATAMDVNRQAWTGATSLLVHPASLYVGLRSTTYFVERGTPLKVDFIVTDLDGKPVPDRPVEVQAARLEWKYNDGVWQEEEADIQKCNQGSTQEPATCTFETPLGGSYRITALVTDDLARQNQSQITRWVSGGKLPPSRNIEQETLSLIPDKETYQPGDIAHILVQAPFSPAEGLLTVSRSGILYTERFHIETDSITLKVPIEEKDLPNLNIQVDLTGSALRSDDQGNVVAGAPPRPAYATGQLNLSIPPIQRTLSLQATPAQSELAPGGETTLDIVVKDSASQPVIGAELGVVVVDEAILALSNYQLADPVSTFYTDRPSYLTSVYGRSSIVLANPQALTQAGESSHVAATAAVEKSLEFDNARSAIALQAAVPTEAPAAAGAPSGAASEPIRVREDFNPLAVFAPAAHSDANGEAHLAVKLPDNLTRYRVMVVAVDNQGRKFGMAETNLTARLPLMVRPSAPRFLNFGDRFELPVVLQNQTGAPMVVDVAVEASNLELTGDKGRRVTIPAHDRVEVRFPAAAQMAGTARIQIAAVAENGADLAVADAATVELPVYTPATTEAFATYGVVDQGAVVQPVAAPTGVFPQYGGLEVSTSSTALQALTDAVLYLVSYPYECSEQLSSRILAVAALRNVLSAFNAKGLPSPSEMEASVTQDIQTLQGLQNEDGGFPYWRRGQDSIPFNTIHVTHALVRAGAKGYTVPADMQLRALEYLRQIESHYPDWYSQPTRWTLSAYALFVRNLEGDRDPEKAVKLINEAGLQNLSLDALGWLWPVLQGDPAASSQLDDLRRLVNNRVVETAGAANFTSTYDDQNYLLLGSDRRTDAILLDALIGDNPQHDLIPKLVNGLLTQRTSGRWESTQENIFVLLALDRYFNTFEAQTPKFVTRLWLGQGYAGSQSFNGYTTDRHETDIPMAYLVDPAMGGGVTQNLVLSKKGAGRLYYRLGLSYAPSNLHLDPVDMGFVVQRRYEAVDDPNDVSQDKEGTWHIKSGARVRIHLTMVADNRRYHVALVDPLPAGLEIINPAIDVNGSVPQDPNSPDYRYGWWWWGTWYEHQNLRDERAEVFSSLLWDGVYQYTYTARATTPGTFVAPPAKAEEMYSPEVFGRSGSDVVIIN
jgi:uncharacterized protein YfaS (alpha-2-macroglobulin family)